MKSITDNFQLSVLDFFSVLLPGAVAEALLYQLPEVKTALAELLPFMTEEWQWSIAFLLGAYVMGHILFFLGAYLDDLVYDPWKEFIWGKDELVPKVGKIKKRHLGFDEPKLLNNYKWSRAQFLMNYPQIYALVERYEADSKFFRSLAVAMLIGILVFCRLNGVPYAGWLSGAGLILMVVFIWMPKPQKPTDYRRKNARRAVLLLAAVALLGILLLAGIYRTDYFLPFAILMLVALIMYLRQRQKGIRTTYEHILAVYGAPLSEHSDTEIPADLRILNVRIGEAEKTKDTEFFIFLLSEDLVFRRANEQINDKTQFLKGLETVTYDYLRTEVDNVRQSDDGESAVVIARVSTAGRRDGKAFEGVFQNLRFFRKDVAGRWKLCAWYNEKIQHIPST